MAPAMIKSICFSSCGPLGKANAGRPASCPPFRSSRDPSCHQCNVAGIKSVLSKRALEVKTEEDFDRVEAELTTEFRAKPLEEAEQTAENAADSTEKTEAKK